MQTAYEESEEVCAHLHRTLTHVRAELAEREEQVEVLERSVAFREEVDAEVKPLPLLHISGVKVSRFYDVSEKRKTMFHLPYRIAHSPETRRQKRLWKIFFILILSGNTSKNAFCKYRTLSHFHVPFSNPVFFVFFHLSVREKAAPVRQSSPYDSLYSRQSPENRSSEIEWKPRTPCIKRQRNKRNC